jgi:hypothetical protein
MWWFKWSASRRTHALVRASRERSGHLVHCGTIWRYGVSVKQPMRGRHLATIWGVRHPEGRLAELLSAETRSGGLVTTVLQPGHISGPAWPPIGPLGNLDLDIWYALSAGQEIAVQTSALSSCTTSTPTMWRRPSNSRSSTATRRLGSRSIRNVSVIRGATRQQEQRTVPWRRRRCDHSH